jgi:hypothetical protein
MVLPLFVAAREISSGSARSASRDNPYERLGNGHKKTSKQAALLLTMAQA